MTGPLVHFACASVSVWPTVVLPEIVGTEVFFGTGGTATEVGKEVAGKLVPPAFVADSCTSIA